MIPQKIKAEVKEFSLCFCADKWHTGRKQKGTAHLCRELALLLHTGIGAADGLFLIAEQTGDARTRAMLEAAARQLT